MLTLHMLAFPRRRAPKLRIVLSRCCFMLWSWTRVTIVFSSLTASFLVAVITSSTVLFVSEPLVFLVRSLHNCSSQHSSSCTTLSLPVTLVALMLSCQRVRKYNHSSMDPAADTVGHWTFLTLAAASAALASEAVCVPVEWTKSNAAAMFIFDVFHFVCAFREQALVFWRCCLVCAGKVLCVFCCACCRCFACSWWCCEYGGNKMAVKVMQRYSSLWQGRTLVIDCFVSG